MTGKREQQEVRQGEATERGSGVGTHKYLGICYFGLGLSQVSAPYVSTFPDPQYRDHRLHPTMTILLHPSS